MHHFKFSEIEEVQKKELWNWKSWRETVRDHGWDITERICRARRRLKNGDSGKKVYEGKVRRSGGNKVEVKQNLFCWENLGTL